MRLISANPEPGRAARARVEPALEAGLQFVEIAVPAPQGIGIDECRVNDIDGGGFVVASQCPAFSFIFASCSGVASVWCLSFHSA